MNPRPVKRKKRVRKEHPVLIGRAPNFLFLIKGKKEKKSKNVPKPVNKIILDIVKKNKKSFLKNMEHNMGSIRGFLVSELGPKMLPLISAIEEARDVLSEITNGEVNSTAYTTLMKQLTLATEVKISSFISEYLDLDEEERERFHSSIEIERQHVKELLKLQKMGNVQGSGQGLLGVLLQEIRSLQRGNKGRGAKSIQR